jgi:hypothetical protein
LLGAGTGKISKRQTTEEIKEALATLLGAIENIGKPWPASTIPVVRKTPSESWAGASQVTVRYGPYRIPGITVRGSFLNWRRMIANGSLGEELSD